MPTERRKSPDPGRGAPVNTAGEGKNTETHQPPQGGGDESKDDRPDTAGEGEGTERSESDPE